MHYILSQLGLRPRPRWGSLQRSPDSLATLRGPTSKRRKRKETGKGEKERDEKARSGNEKR